MTVNRWKDWLERTGWTAIQAAAAAGVVALTDPHITWAAAGKLVGVAAAVAALKVLAAQQAGAHPDGAAIPGGVIEPEKPKAPLREAAKAKVRVHPRSDR